MTQEARALCLIVLSSLLGVLGQVLFKQSTAAEGGFQLFGIELLRFGAGGAVYMVSLVIYVAALRWVPVHLAYPTLAVGYVLVFALALATGEKVSIHQGVAVVMIVGGVALLWT